MKANKTTIGFVFTNYFNSEITKNAIQSIHQNGNESNSSIVIVDNNSDKHNREILNETAKEYCNVHIIFNDSNVGYFGGLNIGLKYLRKKGGNIRYIVIGNNDLIFPCDFIVSIHNNLKNINKYAVISPNIITLDGQHQNPHVINAISGFREMIYDLYYSNYYVAKVIKYIASITNQISDRRDEEQFNIAQTITQGYGACYILTPLFFDLYESLWAPTFLMGEEYFLSKQLESKKQKIFYEPTIIVKHQFHASMDQIPRKKVWEISRDSHKVYSKFRKSGNKSNEDG
jgi:GT2 family glycosyltransferase